MGCQRAVHRKSQKAASRKKQRAALTANKKSRATAAASPSSFIVKKRLKSLQLAFYRIIWPQNKML